MTTTPTYSHTNRRIYSTHAEGGVEADTEVVTSTIPPIATSSILSFDVHGVYSVFFICFGAASAVGNREPSTGQGVAEEMDVTTIEGKDKDIDVYFTIFVPLSSFISFLKIYSMELFLQMSGKPGSR
ncbi:hypothetical protein GYMLUDRAFT_251961 [Collybiopsis luxurians FD-317 M1]|uniref:Uncharacterized protein n=1 Tax=Collybiopsis luxurians FD-317 M1 TaxID=944289 RepID=A0A0D0BPR0_9AGAR|nr:hypothetical protein GYMLUDRAFT_251961 [Collybiopsis luxurians FD-317 M1]